jgi:hypothetical protein
MALCCDIAILQGYLELELFLCEWVITDESFAFTAEQRINGSFRSQNKNTWIKVHGHQRNALGDGVVHHKQSRKA